jgi:hypothetical protein
MFAKATSYLHKKCNRRSEAPYRVNLVVAIHF